MKPQKQKYHHDPANGVYGDCYRTCVAAILDMDRDNVPNFSEAFFRDGKRPPSMTSRLRAWLAPHGLSSFEVPWPGETKFSDLLQVLQDMNPGIPIMITGESSRYPGEGHVIVAMDGEIVCNPSESTLVGPVDVFWWTEVICAIDGRCVDRAGDAEVVAGLRKLSDDVEKINGSG